MGAAQRNKGKAGEREVAAIVRDLTGWDVRRRVRQHDGDSDLEGVPGWSVEVKNHAKASLANVRGWWEQAVEQAAPGKQRPVLFYKRQRGEWRAVWPLECVRLTADPNGYQWTVEGSIDAWACVARESKEV